MNNEEKTKEKPISKRESLTLYFNADLVEQIDEFIHQNKKQLPINKRKKLNRTTLIRVVMQDLFDNYYSKFGNNSELWRIFSKWVDE